MEKQELLLLLIVVVGFLTFCAFFLYTIYEPIATESAGEAAARLVLRSFIMYAAIMAVTILLLLIAFWVEIFVLKPKFSMGKIEAQEWVVKGEVKIENELRRMRQFIATGNLPAAETSYKAAIDIYNWLQEYEMSDRTKQDYYLRLDKARLELEGATVLGSQSGAGGAAVDTSPAEGPSSEKPPGEQPPEDQPPSD